MPTMSGSTLLSRQHLRCWPALRYKRSAPTAAVLANVSATVLYWRFQGMKLIVQNSSNRPLVWDLAWTLGAQLAFRRDLSWGKGSSAVKQRFLVTQRPRCFQFYVRQLLCRQTCSLRGLVIVIPPFGPPNQLTLCMPCLPSTHCRSNCCCCCSFGLCKEATNPDKCPTACVKDALLVRPRGNRYHM